MKIKTILLFFIIIITFYQLNGKKTEKTNKITDMENIIGKQVYIKAGNYFIGNNKEKDNKPLRKKYFKSFYIDITPVTNKQYLKFIKESSYKPMGKFLSLEPEKNPYLPATALTYYDAKAYAKYYHKRLPTEWEWEIAARSLRQDVIYVSIALNHRKRGHFIYDRIYRKEQVCSYPPNIIGIYGMAGNVFEWTKSEYDDEFLYGKYYKKHKIMVLRGGSWSNNSTDVRTTTRTPFAASRELNWLGFRCVSKTPVNTYVK